MIDLMTSSPREVFEARSSLVRLSTMDPKDELLLTLDNNYGKLESGAVTVTKMEPAAHAKNGPVWKVDTTMKFQLMDRFGSTTVVDLAKAKEILR